MNNIFRRTSAGLLSLLMVFGSVPAMPTGNLTGSIIGAFAEGEEQPGQDTPIGGQTAQTEPEMFTLMIDIFKNKISYNNTDYELTPGNTDCAAYRLLSSGRRIAKSTKVSTNSGVYIRIHLADGQSSSYIDIENGQSFSEFNCVYQITGFSVSESINNPGNIRCELWLQAVHAAVTGVATNADKDLGFIEYSGEPEALVTARTATDGEMYYNVTDTSVDTAPIYEWNNVVPTKTAIGDYRVWYYAKGENDCLDSEIAYVDVSIHNVKRPVSMIKGDTKLIVSMTSGGENVTDGKFYYGKKAEIVSKGKLEFRGSDNKVMEGIESFDDDAEEYTYSFTMPDDDIFYIHDHFLRVTPSKDQTSDTFTVSCLNECGDDAVVALYKLEASDAVYTGQPVEATLISGTENFENFTVKNTPTIIYKDSVGSELGEAPTNAGTYTAEATISYKINGRSLSRTISKEFTISPKDIAEAFTVSLKISHIADELTYEYDGKKHSPSLTELPNGSIRTPTIDGDYTLTCAEQRETGEYDFTLTGTGNFSGEYHGKWTITKPTTVTGVSAEAPNAVYSGTAYASAAAVYDTSDLAQAIKSDVDNSKASVSYSYAVIPANFEGNDYSGLGYSAEAPAEVGSYAVRAFFKGSNFDDFAVYDSFEITPLSIVSGTSLNTGFTVNTDALTYNGEEQTASVTLKYGETVLEEGKDYTLTCEEKTDAGTYAYTVTGMGNFTGTYKGSWTIAKYDLSVCGDYIMSGTVYSPTQFQLFADGVSCDENILGFGTDEKEKLNSDKFPFVVTIDGSTDFPDTLDETKPYNISITAKEDSNFTGSFPTQSFTPSKLTTYGMPVYYTGKEYDGHYLNFSNFKLDEEVTTPGTTWYKAFNNGEPQIVNKSGWNTIIVDGQKRYISEDGKTTYGDGSGNLVYWVDKTEYAEGNTMAGYYPPECERDGISAGIQYVIFCVNNTEFEHKNFSYYVYITKAKPENIHGVELIADDKVFDGKPYDGKTTAFRVGDCEQFEKKEDNLLAQEVVANHKMVTYAYATVPAGFDGTDYSGLTFEHNAPAKPGSYAVRATTYGDNFEEVSFYDTFSITRSSSSAATYATVTITTVNGAQYKVGSESTIQSGSTMTVKTGTPIDLHAVDPNSVQCWMQDGSWLSEQSNIIMTVNGNTVITLVYKQPATSQVFVQFRSDYGQILQYRQYSKASEIVLPAGPTKLGYDFDKWVFADTEEEATAEAIMSRKNEAVILKPTYTKQNVTCTVTVDYEGVERTADVYEDSRIGSVFTAEAPAIEGFTFSHWKDASGQTLGYQNTLYVRVPYDISLTACYVPEGTVLPAAVPVITLGTPYTVNDGTEHKVSCIATRSVPEGYSVLEVGMLYATNSELTEEEFTTDAVGVSKYKPENTEPNGFVTMNVKVNDDNANVTFRGYMIVKYNSTNETKTMYTGLVTASYSGISG